MRAYCLLSAVAAALLMLPGTVRAQDPDVLWTEDFMTEPSRPWTREYGNWRDLFTMFRGKVDSRRDYLIYEASARTPVSEGEPLGSWRSVVRLRCFPSLYGELPDILQIRHNITADQRGFGLEIAFSSMGKDQIRLVRYDPGYSPLMPFLAQVDTTLNQVVWYTVKFSVLHMQVGESRVAEVQAKVWKDGESEPDGWLLEGISDVAIEDGNDIGVGAWSLSAPPRSPYVDVDYVTVLVNKSPVEATSWGQIKKFFR